MNNSKCTISEYERENCRCGNVPSLYTSKVGATIRCRICGKEERHDIDYSQIPDIIKQADIIRDAIEVVTIRWNKSVTELKTEYEEIRFEEQHPSINHRIFECVLKRNTIPRYPFIGCVRWIAWRNSYTYVCTGSEVYDIQMLKDIADFIEQLMREEKP